MEGDSVITKKVSKKKIHDRQIVDVKYLRQDSFTIAVVTYKNGYMGIGVSKCNPGDKYNPRVGKLRAVKRAAPSTELSLKNMSYKRFGFMW